MSAKFFNGEEPGELPGDEAAMAEFQRRLRRLRHRHVPRAELAELPEATDHGPLTTEHGTTDRVKRPEPPRGFPPETPPIQLAAFFPPSYAEPMEGGPEDAA